MPRLLAALLVLAAPALAGAQDALEEVPEPPRGDDAISDVELIRWASNVVREHEGRPPAPPHAPVPPDGYVGTGVDGPLALPNESERDAVRLLAELGGGALGVLIGGGIGTLIVWGATLADANPQWMMVAWAAGTTLGAFGVTTGVVLAGDASGGRGNYGHAFIGQLIGGVAALPLVTIGLAEDAPALAVVAAGLLPLAGAVLGYEMSHAEGGSGPTVLVTPTQGGAAVGVAGVM